ncbi:MAG: hypothetical protein P8Y23_16695 [Candidatus Lokiarchaeota archaeon]
MKIIYMYGIQIFLKKAIEFQNFVPKFREKVENEIAKYEQTLLNLENEGIKFKKGREKFQKKVRSLLSKPNQWYKKMMDEFTERIERISPLYDYLDTDERKVIENFETRSSEYFKILDSLNVRAKFDLQKNKSQLE